MGEALFSSLSLSSRAVSLRRAATEAEHPKPVAVGSQIAFVARFLGRTLAYTYEVKEWVPGERFVMATAQGTLPDGNDLHMGRHSRRLHADDASQPWGAIGVLEDRRADDGRCDAPREPEGPPAAEDGARGTARAI
jgi:hypothetical protein